MAIEPCKAEFDKFAKEYRKWDREDESAGIWGWTSILTDLAAFATCVGTIGVGCAGAAAGALAVYAEANDAYKDEATAAEEANGAFAEYLICAMHHKNFYRGSID